MLSVYGSGNSLLVRKNFKYGEGLNCVEEQWLGADAKTVRKITREFNADNQLVLEIQQETEQPLPVASRFNYKLDSKKQNWQQRTRSSLVHRNDNSFYEPTEITYRTINYE